MRKVLALALWASAYGGFAAAADLNIAAGQTYTITADQSDLRLDRLTLGDSAQVRFADGVSRWRVEAKRVNIGNNVVIDGRGQDGMATAAAGGEAGERAKDCEPGAPGKPGTPGVAGGNGVNLVFWWGIESWGSAKILTDGGAGSAGGSGGKGQDGGKVNRCNGPAGGDGGRGGAGGAGGKAGDIALSYFSVADKGATPKERLAISSIGGKSAAGGAGGEGGAGAEGRFQRSANSEMWFSAGKAGDRGAAGSAGASGVPGAVTIVAVAAASSPLWSAEAGSLAPADRGTVQSLQKQVQALQSGSLPAATATDQIQSLQDRLQKLEDRVRALESH